MVLAVSNIVPNNRTRASSNFQLTNHTLHERIKTQLHTPDAVSKPKRRPCNSASLHTDALTAVDSLFSAPDVPEYCQSRAGSQHTQKHHFPCVAQPCFLLPRRHKSNLSSCHALDNYLTLCPPLWRAFLHAANIAAVLSSRGSRVGAPVS